MKRFIPALIAAATLSATAQAGSINYDFRADFNSTDYNKDAGLPDFNKFYVKTGRVDFKGNLNETVSYRLRWAFNKPAVGSATATGASNYSRDNLNGSVEYAFINQKFSDLFDLSVGKFYTEIGGIEGATSSADLYLVSPIYSAAGTVTPKTGATLYSADLLYNTGLKAGFNFADQTIYALATDNVSDANAGAGFNQSKNLMGLVWKGYFLEEKALGFYLSYHEVSPQTTGATAHLKDDKHTFMGGGVKWEAKPTLFTLEYYTTQYKTDAGPKDTMAAVIAKYAFTGWETWIPRLELAHTEEKVETATAQKVTYDGVGVILEYKPTSDMFRYHAGYTMVSQKSDLTTDDKTKTKGEFVLGTRIYGDFLK